MDLTNLSIGELHKLYIGIQWEMTKRYWWAMTKRYWWAIILVVIVYAIAVKILDK